MSLPAKRSKRVKEGRALALEKRRAKIRKMVLDGMSSSEIALQMAPNDEVKRKRIRGLVRRMVALDEELQERFHIQAHGTLQEGIIPATEALARRAARGRPDAIKLLYEASGFHNPKIQHEHSGEVKVSLSMMPRPEHVQNPAALEEPVVDATVVEDE